MHLKYAKMLAIVVHENMKLGHNHKNHKFNAQLSEKYSPLWKSSARHFIPPQTGGMIRFYSNIGCSESKVIFKWQKNNNDNKKKQIKRLYKEQTSAPRIFHSVSVITHSHSDSQPQANHLNCSRDRDVTCDIWSHTFTVFRTPPLGLTQVIGRNAS